MASDTHDDGFREIQLNGKQLVFLFMATTVISVVIFLLGVMFGRGVRSERGLPGETTVAGAVATDPATLAAAPPPSPAPVAAGSDPTQAAPPAEVNDLTYFNRLEDPKERAETLKPQPVAKASPEKAPVEKAPVEKAPAEKAVAAPPVAVPPPVVPTAAKVTAPAAAVPTSAPAPGSGYVVQVAALNARGEADSVAKRLSDKGYAAFVLGPANGTPAVYRVRVGTFKTKREAETMAAKLEKEEQFKPWITR